MDNLILPRLPKPQPNVEHFRQVLQRGPADRVPLVELAIAEETLTTLHGRPLIPLSRQDGPQRFREAIRQRTQALTDQLRWSRVVQPLLAFCREPYRAADLTPQAALPSLNAS